MKTKQHFTEKNKISTKLKKKFKITQKKQKQQIVKKIRRKFKRFANLQKR